jgi:hypothetical protein
MNRRRIRPAHGGQVYGLVEFASEGMRGQEQRYPQNLIAGGLSPLHRSTHAGIGKCCSCPRISLAQRADPDTIVEDVPAWRMIVDEAAGEGGHATIEARSRPRGQRPFPLRFAAPTASLAGPEILFQFRDGLADLPRRLSRHHATHQRMIFRNPHFDLRAMGLRGDGFIHVVCQMRVIVSGRPLRAFRRHRCARSNRRYWPGDLRRTSPSFRRILDLCQWRCAKVCGDVNLSLVQALGPDTGRIEK